MLDFEFYLNTGNSPPVCCRQPVYGFYESKLMTTQMADLEANGIITDCVGSWGSLLLLTAKLYQESCDDTNTFIWRLWGSYRPLNRITLGLEFPVPRCVDSIEDLSDSRGSLSMISLDARSGYHQNRVRDSDQKKLVFFTPSGTKKNFVLCLSVLKMLHHFTLLWCSLYAPSDFFCSQIPNMLFHVITFLIHLSVMIRLSLMIFYSTLTISLHFFTIFLVFPKCLRNIACYLN